MHQPRIWNVACGVGNTRYKENVLLSNHNFHSRQRENIQNYDYQHWCETCDRGFATQRFLENHKLQHQKCNIDGCQFVAHSNIITKHIQMQHSTGLFKRIAKLNNPDDIKKWREERKRKYPTIENIKRKQAEIKEKIKRGEKIGLQYERKRRNATELQHKNNQRNRAKSLHGKSNKNITINRKRVGDISIGVTKKKLLSKKICKILPDIENSRTLKPFAGLHSLPIAEDLDDENESENQVPIDDEDMCTVSESEKTQSSKSEPIVCSALTSLMCFYGSSDEDDVDTNNKEINKHKSNTADIKSAKIGSQGNENSISKNDAEQISKSNQDTHNKVTNCQGGSDNESEPEEIKISREGIHLPADSTTHKTKHELCSKKINGPPAKRYQVVKRHKLPSTLLEKLLHREIQHERNIILQCVRHVIKNKYFENN